MKEFYNPEIKPTLIPDLATTMYDTTHKSIFDGNPYGSAYRVSGYLKAVPKTFRPSNKEEPWMNDMMKRLFSEWHPNWRKEYRLVPCLKEEATHVWGTGVCGCTASLTDSRYVITNEPIGWSEEQRKKYNDEWVENLPHLLDRMYDLQVVEGVKHTKGYMVVKKRRTKKVAE